ncbi:hypothetical protein IHE45_05G138200 [Dioscorea alata]|uniref:Uncharacterized protein n=1 Tax=Dioscorea alata TaxID=55571 RepID=A0ACB7W521_DIOAL|nr:hypothetical protein IHE45_05G138200 [Dioscorea alata]
MARLLQAYHISINPSSLSLSNITSFLIFLAGVTGTLSIIMLLCTTYKHTKISKASQSGLAPSSPPPQRENKFLSHLSSKALVVVKMVSWKKVEEEDDDDVDDDVDDQAVWRKAIIMGDKCRPQDFSGQILYDSQGNPLPEPPARSHRRHEMF